MDNSSTQESQIVPRHVAIIMDGNGRWAKARGLPRLEGHRQGSVVVESITEEARQRGVQFLTLYAFSQENWNRPPEETMALMQLLYEFLQSKRQKMLDNGIRLQTIGDRNRLPSVVREILEDTIAATAGGDSMQLTLALSYGARDEITRAVQKVVKQVQDGQLSTEAISEAVLSAALDTAMMPDPDLIVRTSGEIRISNFLLWQGAYAEYIFLDQPWPDFTREDFAQCLAEYNRRERRFGKVSEQL